MEIAGGFLPFRPPHVRQFGVRRLLHGLASPLLIAGALGLVVSLLMASVALLSESVDTVSAQQQSTDQELALHSDNGSPRGIWSDSTTMWVADFSDGKLYAYSLADASRLEGRDIDLGGSNFKPLGIWSDGTTMWALSTRDDKLYGYSLADGSRFETRDISLDANNDTPEGIWSDHTTMYVVDQNDTKLYAYSLSDGGRQSDRDVTIPIDRPRPIGLWSDRSTFWISYDHHQDYSDDDDRKLFAFRLEDGARQSELDVPISTDPNSRVSEIWSDGTTMWVTDRFYRKIFSYQLPRPTPSSDATLKELRLGAGSLTPDFAATTTTYTASVPYDVTELTVHATSSDSSAEVVLVDGDDSELADVDPMEAGHQVRLAINENVINVQVTAEDETTVLTYSVTVTRERPEVSIGSQQQDVVEGDSGELVVMRDSAIPEHLDVAVSVSETGSLLPPAEEGVRTVTIASDATSTVFLLTTDIDDDEWEDHSLVTVAIVEDEKYRISATASSTGVRLLDDDFPAASATLSVSPNPLAEGATTTATITVTTQADRQPHGDGGTLRLSQKYVTAESGDLTPLSQDLIDVSASDFSTTTVGGNTRYRAHYTATLRSAEDDIVEIGETLEIELSKATSSRASLTVAQPSAVAVSILDNDAALSFLELSGITLSPEFASNIHEYQGQADYALEETSVSASAGHTDSAEPTISLGGVVASDGTVPLEVGENEIVVEAIAEDATTTAKYVITVTRARPRVSVNAVAAEVGEGHAIEFLISRDAAVSVPLDVEVAISESGSLVQATSLGSRTVTIPGAATTATTTVLTQPDNSVWDHHSTVTATVAGADTIQIETTAGEASTLVRDDDFPEATSDIVVAPNPVSEGAVVSATITVTTKSEEDPHGSGGTLYISASGVTARTADYGRFGQTSFQVEPVDFALVEVSGAPRYQASYTAAVAITDDSESEPNEQFQIVVTKTNSPRIELPAPATTTVVISANDSSTDPTLSQLTLSAGTLSPAFSSTTTQYSVSLDYGVEQVTVKPTVNSDNSTVEFLDGSSSDLADDSTSDDGHQVGLEVGENTVRVKVTAEDTVTTKVYTIVLNRQKPEVSIVSHDSDVSEGDSLLFTIARNAQDSVGLDVRVEIGETGAMVASLEEGGRTVALPPNSTSTTFTVSTEHDDQEWELHSTVTATIAASETYTIGQDVGRAETLVKDDDFPEAWATLAVNPDRVSEGANSTLSITLTTMHDQEPHGPGGTLTLTPVDGTAADEDYRSPSQTTFDVTDTDLSRLEVGSGNMVYRAVYTATVETVDDSESEPHETIVFLLDKGADAAKISIEAPATTTLTILANDASSDASLSGFGISDGTLSPPFAATTTSYTASVSYGVEQVTLEYSRNDSGAEITTLGADSRVLDDASAATGFQVDLEVGSNVVRFIVTAEDDSEMETYVVTITRLKPEVGIVGVDSNVPEGNAITFTVTRDEPAAEALDVIVKVGETEMLLAVGENGQSTITIPSRATTTSITIATDTDDDVWEEHSTVTASIVASSTYEITGGLERAQVLVEDNDFPEAVAELELSPDPVSEGDQLNARVTVTTKADQQPHGDGGTLFLTLTGDTAHTDDFEFPHEVEFDIAAMDFLPVVASSAARYRASYSAATTITDDEDAEPAETLIVTISGRNASKIVLPAHSTSTVTIAPSDLSADAALSSLVVSEGTLSPAFASTTTDYTVSVDYSVEKLVITPTANDSTATISVSATGVSSGRGHVANLSIGTSTVELVVTAQDSLTTKTYTVVVVRAKPEVSISPLLPQVSEGADVNFSVSRSAAVSSQLELWVDIAESGDLVPADAEGSRSVIIPAGATSTTLTVSTDMDDETWEEHSVVSATIASRDGYLVKLIEGVTEVAVKDDDFPDATASVSISPNPVAEGETVTVTATVRTASSEQPHRDGGTLMLEVGAGTAQSNDYGSLSQVTFSISEVDFIFDAGSHVYISEYRATIEITEDDEVETGENFNISLSLSSDSPKSLTLGQPISESVSIRDFSVGLVDLDLSGVDLSPQFSSDTLNYTGTVPYPIVQTMVSATTTEASSQSPLVSMEGVPVTNRRIPLSIGENPVNIDVKAEGSSDTRTYVVNVTREKPEVGVSVSNSQAAEGAVLGYTVTRSTSAPDTLDVMVKVVEDGELVPAGSLGEGIRSVIIPAGATSTSFAVETDEDDQVWDAHSTVTVAVVASDQYVTNVSEGVAETLILDDDFPESIASMSVDPGSVIEGGSVTLNVEVTTVHDEVPHTNSGPLTVETVNDSAIAGADYISLPSSDGTLSFLKSDFDQLDESGQTRYRASKLLMIETLRDNDQEGIEKFVVTLDRVTEGPATTSNQISLDASSQMITVTIEDAPETELAALELSEGTLMPLFGTSTRDYAAEVTCGVEVVTLTATTSRDGTKVTFHDSNDVEIADQDQNTEGHQVPLAVGENTIEVKVSEADNTVLETYSLTVTRVVPVVSIASTTTSVLEGEAAIFTVHRDFAPSESLRVAVSVSETGEMVGDSSQGEGNRSVTIPGYATSTNLTVITDPDDEWEEHSIVSASIDAQDTYAPSADSRIAEVQVTDDDFPAATATLAVSPSSVAEGRPVFAVVTVTTGLDQVPHRAAGAIQLVLDGVTASSGSDFILPNDRLAFAADDFEPVVVGGQARYSASAGISVSTVSDGEYEGPETFTIEILPVTEGSSTTAPQIRFNPNESMREVTISDTDDVETGGGDGDNDNPPDTGGSQTSVTGGSGNRGGGGGSSRSTSNHEPKFEEGGETSREIEENSEIGAKVGAQVRASDRDKQDRLTYSLRGEDQSSFTINEFTGRIQTAISLDRESDSRHYLTVEVSDSEGGTDSIKVTIIVTDVDESPAVTGEQAVTHPEQTSGVLATYEANDPENGEIDWTLSGVDAVAFDIDAGALSFASTPDYEGPTDANRDNSYELTVSASDSVHTSTLDVIVTVADLDESPSPTPTPLPTPTSVPPPAATAVPTVTPLARPTSIPSPVPTQTVVQLPTATATLPPVATATAVPRPTETPTPAPVPTLTPTPMPTPLNSGTPSMESIATPRATNSPVARELPSSGNPPATVPTTSPTPQATLLTPPDTPSAWPIFTDVGVVPAWFMLSITFWAILATGVGVYVYLRHR